MEDQDTREVLQYLESLPTDEHESVGNDIIDLLTEVLCQDLLDEPNSPQHLEIFL